MKEPDPKKSGPDPQHCANPIVYTVQDPQHC